MKFHRTRGFTSLDFLFLLAVLITMTALAAWNLSDTYRQANELSAMTTLRIIAHKQEEFRNQHSEYAFLKELSGLPKEMDLNDPKSGLYRGYLYQIFLPLQELPGAESNAQPVKTFPQARERWCAYAWPVSHRLTGSRPFFINETGQLYTSENVTLSGRDPKKLDADFAYRQGKPFSEVNTAVWSPLGQETE
jgi:type II secretory pathway pseudopilin PulG